MALYEFEASIDLARVGLIKADDEQKAIDRHMRFPSYAEFEAKKVVDAVKMHCVLHIPNRLTAEQQASLKIVAEQAMNFVVRDLTEELLQISQRG